MKLCDNHPTICYESQFCPVCEAENARNIVREELLMLKYEYEKLQDEAETLRGKICDRNDVIDELAKENMGLVNVIYKLTEEKEHLVNKIRQAEIEEELKSDRSDCGKDNCG